MSVESAEQELIKFKEEKANILGPSTHVGELSEFHKVVLDSVQLSVNPADGDIYKHKDGFKDKPALFIITGQGLQRLAVCAGVFWNPNETKSTTQSQNYVAYRAVGCIRKSDGAATCFQAEYDIDMDVVRDELDDQFAEKRKKWDEASWFKKLGADGQNDYVESALRKELNFKKKHKTKIAASGAKNRVIRALLGVKKTYTMEELKKPFVMPRVVLAPDFKDPDVKKMMLTAAIQAQTNLFGSAPASTSTQIEEEIVDLSENDFHTVPDDDDAGSETLGDNTTTTAAATAAVVAAAAITKEKDNKKSPAADDEAPSSVEVFESLSPKEQVETLKKTAKAKGYSPKQSVDKLAKKERINFYAALDKMPDAEEVKE